MSVCLKFVTRKREGERRGKKRKGRKLDGEMIRGERSIAVNSTNSIRIATGGGTKRLATVGRDTSVAGGKRLGSSVINPHTVGNNGG